MTGDELSGCPTRVELQGIRHIREAVCSFWDLTADVLGAVSVAGVTGDVVVLCAMGSVGVVGDVGATGDTGVLGAPGVTCITVAVGSIRVLGAPGFTDEAGITGVAAVTSAAGAAGKPGPARGVVGTSMIGGSCAARILGVVGGGDWAGGDGPRLWAGLGSGRLSGLLP